MIIYINQMFLAELNKNLAIQRQNCWLLNVNSPTLQQFFSYTNLIISYFCYTSNLTYSYYSEGSLLKPKRSHKGLSCPFQLQIQFYLDIHITHAVSNHFIIFIKIIFQNYTSSCTHSLQGIRSIFQIEFRIICKKKKIHKS